MAGLLAVLLIFGDALLTVEVHKVSMETGGLRNDLRRLELDLGTLESEWASRSSRLELAERASELGLTVPEPGQVVVLHPDLLEGVGRGRAPDSAELRRALVNNWMLLNPMGIP
jgi:hypothetical protein